MPNIKLTDLNGIAGVDLFSDSENFMQDLSENELALHGGKVPQITARESTFCRPFPQPTPPVFSEK